MTKKILIIIAIIIGVLFFLRFLSPEDAWICSQGEWVKHGSPSAEKPTLSCPVK